MLAIERGVYALTDYTSLSDEAVLARTEQLLRTGLSLLQYRDKSSIDHDRKTNRARELQRLCKEFNTPFIVNDDIKLAALLQADGVHLGRHDTPIAQARDFLGDVIIGVSCYNELDAGKLAQQQGADYIAFGAFYPSQTKTNAVRATPELLSRASEDIHLPLVAIGGITPENGKVLIDCGADLLAVITALYAATDTVLAINNFKQLFKPEQN